jgi:hypothetical protein
MSIIFSLLPLTLSKRAGWQNGKVLYLYSGDFRFESRQRHSGFSLRSSVTPDNNKIILRSGHDHFLTNFFSRLFIFSVSLNRLHFRYTLSLFLLFLLISSFSSTFLSFAHLILPHILPVFLFSILSFFLS